MFTVLPHVKLNSENDNAELASSRYYVETEYIFYGICISKEEQKTHSFIVYRAHQHIQALINAFLYRLPCYDSTADVTVNFIDIAAIHNKNVTY